MVNDALRLLRVFSDKKGTEFASELGISNSYLSEIESGKKKPNLDLIEKYASVLDVRPSALMKFIEDVQTVDPQSKKKKFWLKTIEFLHEIEEAGTEEISATSESSL